MNTKKLILYCFLVCVLCSTLSNALCPISISSPKAAVAYLRMAKTNKTANPDCIMVAIDELYRPQSQDAIDILAQYLDFKRPNADHEVIWSAHYVDYPATTQLFSIRQAALPALVHVLGSENFSAIARKNALETIMQIHRENPPDGIQFLLNEATHSNAKQASLLRQAVLMLFNNALIDIKISANSY